MMAADTLYIVAVRTKAPKGGMEVRAALKALNEAGLLPDFPVNNEDDYQAIALARPLDELTARANDALRTLGYTVDDANRLIPPGS